MPYYLATWEGSGTDEDGFVPQGSADATNWAAVDLRPDATVSSGRCLLWTDKGVTGADLIQLPDANADNPDIDAKMPDSVADDVANALGIASSKVRGRSTRSLVGGALTDLAADIGVKELRAERDGVRRVRMGGAGLVWDEERDG